MREFSKEQEELLFRYYSMGKTDYDVACLMKVGRDRLRKWRRKNNIISKSRSKGLDVSLCPSIRKRHEQGETYTEIGRSYGVAHSSIIRLLNRCSKERVEVVDPFLMTSKAFNILTKEEQERLIGSAFSHYRREGFPYISYECGKLLGIIRSLIKYEQDLESGEIRHCTIGSNFCEYFFPHMYEASRRDKLSPWTIWGRDDKLRNFLRNRFRYAPKFNDSAIRRGLKLLGGVSNFKPTVAKYVYQKYLPDNGVTYDFSAGYGGRLSGFLASGKKGKYIGVDPLQKTCEGLRNLYKYWVEYVGTDSEIKIIKDCAENVKLGVGEVDLAFSCPPYYDLERYSDDATQSYKKYTFYDVWLQRFWESTVRNCYQMLRMSGYFIYVIGNYSYYDLKRDFERISVSEGFRKVGELQIPLANMFKKKTTKQTFKYESMFIYQKSVRKSLPGDILAVLEMVRYYYSGGIMGMLPSSVYYKAVENENIIVFEVFGEIKGFVLYRFLKRSKKYRIIQIACVKSYLRKKVGTLLLKEIMERGYSILLEVVKKNKAAISFYDMMGFRRISEKDDKLILEFNDADF